MQRPTSISSSSSNSSTGSVRSKAIQNSGGPPSVAGEKSTSVRMTGTDLSAFSGALVDKLFTSRLPFATVEGALRDIAKLNEEWPEPYSRVVTRPRELGAKYELSGMCGAIVLGPVGPQLNALPRVIVSERVEAQVWRQSKLSPQTMSFVQFAGTAPVPLFEGDTVLYFPKPQNRSSEGGAGNKVDAVKPLRVGVESRHESKHAQPVASVPYGSDQSFEQSSMLSSAQVLQTRSANLDASETTLKIAHALANHYAKKAAAKTPANDGLRAVIGKMCDPGPAKTLYESISKCPVEEPGDLVAESVEEGTAGSIIVRATPNLAGTREVILIQPNSAKGYRIVPGNSPVPYEEMAEIVLQKGDTVMLCTQ